MALTPVITDASASPLASASKKKAKCKPGYVRKTVKVKRGHRRVKVRKCVKVKANAYVDPHASATSWGFECDSTNGWVRSNWPTITTESDALTPVYFRALLDRYTTKGWAQVAATIWYVGVSDRYGRHQLDSSLGVLPYPFVGELGHLFAYETSNGSYAGPQLGPWFANLPAANYRTREQYKVNGATWIAGSYVNSTGAAYCLA